MKLKFAFILFCSTSVFVFGQKPGSETKPYSLPDKNKPSVYLSFDSQAVIDEACSSKKRAAYRLALHNNSTKPINVGAHFAASDPTDKITLGDGTIAKALPDKKFVRMCYDVEAVPYYTSKVDNTGIYDEILVRRATPEVTFYCSCAFQQQADRRYDGVWIAPGKSILFAVPKEYLAEDLKIYTLFNYEFEFEGGKLRYNEPHHQVFFYWSGIPKR
ncbi:MAG TPA: hypothetical protein VF721_21855 [Pyrinomonadaceae bacterium]|jgi:hypothetical protein